MYGSANYVNVVSFMFLCQNIFLHCAHPSCDDVGWWDAHTMRWNEVNDIGLVVGFSWPPGDASEGGLSALSDPGSLSYDEVDSQMSAADDMVGQGSWVGWRDFVMLFRTVCNLKLMDYFQSFPFSIFRLQMIADLWNNRKWQCGQKERLLHQTIFFLSHLNH